MKSVVFCYSSSHRKLKQMPKQLTALSCSKLARPSQSWQGPKAEPTPAPSPGSHGGSHPRLPQALSAYQVKPDVSGLGTRHGPASLQSRNQAGSTEARVPTQQAEVGSQVPPWGRGAGRPHLSEAEGPKLITRSLRTKVKWRDFPGGPAVKNSPANAKDRG